MTRTQHPVIFIHGVFGYGRKRPFWNKGAPYWPEHALDALDANYVVVDVGALSSDHDRACEAFYQLYGGRVDYGDEHARRFGHDRFGETFETPLHPQWSAANPVHLLGHSVGATTSIELYQLLCQDAFGVGSDHTWVRSIVSIAGPLSGTTLTHFFGLHDAELVAYTVGHAVGATLSLWLYLQTRYPALKNVFDYRMQQWEALAATSSLRDVFSASNRVLNSPDLAVFDILPARRMDRNRRLRHMDKPYLVSVATASTSKVPAAELGVGLLILGLVCGCAVAWYSEQNATMAILGFLAFTIWLWLRKRIFLPVIQWRMRKCVQRLHEVFDGFNHAEWEHNDGAVNICSMHYPQCLPASKTSYDTDEGGVAHGDADSDSDSALSTASSSDSTLLPVCSTPTRRLEVNRFGFLVPSRSNDSNGMLLVKRSKRSVQRGHWYLHSVSGNHKAGTSFDRASPELYRRLLRLMANEFEN